MLATKFKNHELGHDIEFQGFYNPWRNMNFKVVGYFRFVCLNQIFASKSGLLGKIKLISALKSARVAFYVHFWKLKLLAHTLRLPRIWDKPAFCTPVHVLLAPLPVQSFKKKFSGANHGAISCQINDISIFVANT